jgi:hypothetical protein
MRLVYYPAFADADTLTDRYWRAVHYIGPVAERVESIEITADGRAVGAPPAYLDQALPAREAAIRARLKWTSAPDIAGADIVIVWDAAHADDAALRQAKRVAVLDPNALHEGDLSIEFGASLVNLSGAQHSAAQARFVEALQRERQDVAHVFGTGPSVSAVAAIEPGVSIVCNSLVKDAAFLDRVRPRFITAVDPIFHAGPSLHAAAFRTALTTALRTHRPWFVIQARDAHLYHALLPPDLHDLILPIPVRYALAPNLDLARSFWVAATRNVLTLTMLPLAAGLGRDVRVYGCDGRPADERDRFWDYAPNAAFGPELAQQNAAHPGFFTLDHQEYYALHCETVRRWITAMERRGLRVRTATPSHIPALAARAVAGVASLPPAPDWLIQAGRAAYHYRAAQSAYGAILAGAQTPNWLKHALRVAVRSWRRQSGAINSQPK